MEVMEWLEKVAFVGPSEIQDDDGGIYYSNFDNSYITRVGMEDSVAHLAKYEITEELTHGVGFSPKDNKWYGWSHRAIYGFTIGSKCKKGHCHYMPSTRESFAENIAEFWNSDDHAEHKWEYGTHRYRLYGVVKVPSLLDASSDTPDEVVYGEEEEGVWVKWLYDDTIPNESLQNTWNSHFTPFPDKFGKGEWIAETMEDAKQMAIDFCEGVS